MRFHLILTLDYEVFGNGSGCVDKCVVAPVDRLLTLLDEFSAPCTFFVDATEFAAMERCGQDIVAVREQLSQLQSGGHPIQLHLHPQWLDASLSNNNWNLDFDKWRIGDLAPATAGRLIDEGLDYLGQFTDQPITTFRAGGWCIQPSNVVLDALAERGIVMDSTVAPGVHNPAKGDWFDFRSASRLKPYWPVAGDVCLEVAAGSILEVPIATESIGFFKHGQERLRGRGRPAFPEGCEGSYAGPNSPWQEKLGKLGKLMQMGSAMLDFSTLSGETLIHIVETRMATLNHWDKPVPIVAIGHNKNFTEDSLDHLRTLLLWVHDQDQVGFSTYDTWHGCVS